MIGNDLIKAVSGLRLGNGSVYNFLNYVGSTSMTGGLMRYTIDRGYFANNISGNFYSGMEGRYGYGSRTYFGAKDKIHGTDGVVLNGEGLAPATLYQDRVGDFYSTNYIPDTPFMRFIDIEDFTELGRRLREENLSDNAGEFTFKERYSSANADEKFIAKGVPYSLAGSEDVSVRNESVYSELFGSRKMLDEASAGYRMASLLHSDYILRSQGMENYQYQRIEERDNHNTEQENYYVRTEIYHGDFNVLRPGKKFKILEEVGEEQREILSLLRKDNEFVSKHPNAAIKKSRADVENLVLNYGDLYEKEDESPLKLPMVLNEGIEKYYSNEHVKLGKENSFWMGRSYGVSTTDIPSVYDIDEEVSTPARQKIDPQFTRGTLRTSTPYENDATYGYYQEYDKGAAVQEFGRTNTQIGFTPHIERLPYGSRLMRRTNALFNNNEIRSLVNRFHTTDSDFSEDELVSSFDKNFGMSRGRNLLRKEFEGKQSGDDSSGFDNPYCRVWTAHHQYSTMKDRIRPFMDGDSFKSIEMTQSKLGNLRPRGATQLSNYTTLQDNGYVKVTPYHDASGSLEGGSESLKKYMFSIENLAWKGFAKKDRLSEEQIGENGGRIMWFPPYNLKFTENISTNWRENEFIGRGERIFTYANTERDGTLSFTLLIDHPSILNKWRGMGERGNKEELEKDILRYFAGCGDLDILDNENPPLPPQEDPEEEDNLDNTTPILKPEEEYIEIIFAIFYPNNFTAKEYYGKYGWYVKELTSQGTFKRWKEATPTTSGAERIPTIIARLDNYEGRVNTQFSAGTITNDEEAFKEMDKKYRNQILVQKNYDNWSLFKLNTRQGVMENLDDIRTLLEIDDDAMVYSYEDLKNIDWFLNTGDEDALDGGGQQEATKTIFGYDARDYEIDSVVVQGFASDHGYPEYNRELSASRARTIKEIAKLCCGSFPEDKVTTGSCHEINITTGQSDKKDVNQVRAKIARSATIKFRIKLIKDAKPENLVPENMIGAHYFDDNTYFGPKLSVPLREVVVTSSGRTIEDKAGLQITTSISPEKTYTYMNEYMYFKKISEEDKLVYKNIVDKVKFFDPAFHSITPEGFNARLTFLHQCTRQGPTVTSHAGGEIDAVTGENEKAKNSKFARMAGNLAFGMAPYCILRIGDFYHTKICITALSIDYDGGSGIQWDLNPEGAGVQPMIANVNINFKFIGGSDMSGPVNELQNAISYNYYANASVYTPEQPNILNETSK